MGFIVTVPAEALTARIGMIELAGGGVLALFLFITARWFFNAGLKRYSSASG
ncbi:MAG: hypothetical protein GY950_16385 [bacterium]|nr:hypothetical protein [bacterium]